MSADQLSEHDALVALNELRSNIVATQQASWSNTVYPLVAILNAARLQPVEPTVRQQAEHFDCYGGAGGFPGRALREISDERAMPSYQSANRARLANEKRLALREKGIDPFREEAEHV